METRSEELLRCGTRRISRWDLPAAGAAAGRGRPILRARAPRGTVLEQGAARRRLGGRRRSASSSARWCRGWRCASATCSIRRCRSPFSRCPTPTTSSAHGTGRRVLQLRDRLLRRGIKHIDDSIEEIRSGNLLDRLLKDDKKDTLTWYWQLKTLPDAPESRYLYQLLASNEFQEGLKNYRELNFMSRNLDDWREDVSAYDDMLDTRQQAYNERGAEGRRRHGRHRSGRPDRKRVDFESRINEIEKSNDVAALGTPEEQRTWARLKRIEDFLADASGRSGSREMREKHRLMKGVMYWRLSESFKAGCGTSAARSRSSRPRSRRRKSAPCW
jgi:hypothetical protein